MYKFGNKHNSLLVRPVGVVKEKQTLAACWPGVYVGAGE